MSKIIFSNKCSWLDNIFVVCQTFEKCYEYIIDLHNIFVDYIQASDSINRNKVTDSLNQYTIKAKKINSTNTYRNKCKTKNKQWIHRKMQCPNRGQTGGPIISYALQHCHGLYTKENGTERKHLHQIEAMHCLCRWYLNNYQNNSSNDKTHLWNWKMNSWNMA